MQAPVMLCTSCEGIGALDGAHIERVNPCPHCGGSGREPVVTYVLVDKEGKKVAGPFATLAEAEEAAKQEWAKGNEVYTSES